jgi:hypothetical protein
VSGAARPRRLAFPLLRREWGIVRRGVLGCTVLTALGVAALFLTFDAENRYRTLSDPTMLRTVMLPAGLGVGALCAWLSFVQEMRSGTWDGWLMLPASRTRLLAAKLGVGLCGPIAALLVPSLLLWLGLHAIGDVGGPIIHLHELLLRSTFTLAAIVAVVTYLATAWAASMAREGHVAFAAALLFPLAAVSYFFGSDLGSYGPTPAQEGLAALALAAAMVSLLAVYVVRAGRAPRAIESTLRALLISPVAVVVLLLVAIEVLLVLSRLIAEPREAYIATDWRDDDPSIGVDGTIAPQRPNRSLSTYSMPNEDFLERSPTRRLRTPFSSSDPLQTFVDDDRHVLRAFDKETGREVGCVGPDGLRPDGACRPFDGPPRAKHLAESVVVLTPSSVHAMYPSGRVIELGRGAVHGAVSIRLEDGPDAVAVAIDADVMIVRVKESDDVAAPSALKVEAHGAEAAEQADDETGEKSPAGDAAIEATIACRGLVGPGQRLDDIAVTPSFVGAHVSSHAPEATVDAGHLVVCRDGAVTQRVPFEDEVVRPPPQLGQGDYLAMAMGPAIDRAYTTFRPSRSLIAAPPRVRLIGSVATSVACSLALVLALWWRRRVVAWWVLPGMILGPPYVLSCLLLLWRRPRWASVVGGWPAEGEGEGQKCRRSLDLRPSQRPRGPW